MNRGRLVTAAKWIATIALLVIVVRNVPLGELAERLGRVRMEDVVLLVAVSTAQMALSAARWWRLLRSLGEPVRYKAIFGDVSVGILYNMLLPTSVGGDVVRALRARARMSVPHRAWSTSIFERIVGLFTMAIFASVVSAVGLGSLKLPDWIHHTTYGVTFAFVAIFMLGGLPFRIVARVVGKRLPAAASADLDGIAADLSGPLTRGVVRGEAFGWSIVYQLVSILFVILSARALGAPGYERALFLGIPLVYVLSIAPVSVGGHGLREGLYVGILGALGVPRAVALGLAAAFLASSLLFSLVGAIILLVEPKAKEGKTE